MRVVESNDPQAIAFFVRQHPYHADGLLQMVMLECSRGCHGQSSSN
jgi:hypothetical protein